MHKKSLKIVKGLGFGSEVASDLEHHSNMDSQREMLKLLKELKVPVNATKQIKKIEGFISAAVVGDTNAELLESLVKKCKRSFDAFARKNKIAHIVFSNSDWTLYSEEFDEPIRNLHRVCKPYFDAWASKGLQATILFNGTNKWKAKLKT